MKGRSRVWMTAGVVAVVGLCAELRDARGTSVSNVGNIDSATATSVSIGNPHSFCSSQFCATYWPCWLGPHPGCSGPSCGVDPASGFQTPSGCGGGGGGGGGCGVSCAAASGDSGGAGSNVPVLMASVAGGAGASAGGADGSVPTPYQVVDTSGWPMLNRSDEAAPTGGWITDPVVVDAGEFIFGARDLTWTHDGTAVAAGRTYRHNTANQGGLVDFGRNFHTNLRTLVDESAGSLTATVQLGNGEDIVFVRAKETDPFFTPARWRRYELDKVGGTQYQMTDRNGYQYIFEASADPARLIETKNRYGEGEDYTYNGSGHLIKIKISSTGDIFLERDTDHTITRIRDYAGRTVDYAYDSNNNLTKVEDACGTCSTIPTAEYVYDGSHRIIGVKDADGTTVRTIAYSFERVGYYYDANNATYEFNYGTPDLVIDPVGTTTAYTFDGGGDLLTKVFGYNSALAQTYQFAYDDGHQLTQAILPNGAVVNNTYDGRYNRLLTTMTADGNTVTTYHAGVDTDNYGVITTFTREGVGQASYEYDTEGALTKEIRPGNLIRTYVNNALGQPTSITDATGRVVEYTYDNRGMVLTTTVDPSGLNLKTIYSVVALGATAVTTPEGHTITLDYDKGGRFTKITTAEGIVTEYEYDANGRETKKKIMDGASPLFTWTTAYDAMGRTISTQNPENHLTTYAYDKNGRRTKITDPEGGVAERVYDALGRMVTSRVGNGTSMINQQVLTYDNMNNVVTCTDAEGNDTINHYDGFARSTKTTDALNHYTVYDYNDAGRATTVKRYKSGGTILTHRVTEYDNLGRLTKTRQKDNPGGADNSSDALTEMVYDDENRLITHKESVGATATLDTCYFYDGAARQTKVTDPDGKATTFTYDGDGRRTKLTDANGKDTTYAYDADGKQTKAINPLGDYTVKTFDKRGLRTDVSKYPSGSSNRSSQTKYEYDKAGMQTCVRRMDKAGGTDDDQMDTVTDSFYDKAGKLTKRMNSGDQTTYAYDAFFRQTRVTLPDGSYTTMSYDDAGRLTSQVRYEIVSGSTRSFRTDWAYDALGQVVTKTNQGPDGTFGNANDLNIIYVYDGAGRQITVTNEAGRHTVIEYDDVGRRTRVTEDAGGVGRVTDFAYDRAGRLVTLTAYTDGTTGAQHTVYDYDGRGLNTRTTYEETGAVNMVYDNANNLVTRTDEAGTAIVYAYDSASRLTQRKSGGTDDVERYTYDELGRMITAERGKSNDPDAVSRSVFSYDDRSRVTQESQSISKNAAQLVNYEYDKAGNRTQMIYHGNATTVTYAYDSRDRCTQIDNGTVRLADYTWLGTALHQRDTTCDYPGTTKPKFKTAFDRDGILRVTKVDNEHLTEDMADAGYNDLGEFDYTYDSASNPLSETQAGSMGELDADRAFDYDTLDRLLTARLTDTQNWTAATEKTTWFSYDDVGNRISHQYRDATAIGYTHDDANRLTAYAGKSPSYDLAGNQTSGYSADLLASYTYDYDHHNRLTKIREEFGTSLRKAGFTYDALGRRIEFANDVTGETIRYYYDGVNEIVEHDASDNRSRYYVHGVSYLDERLMMYSEEADRPYYYTIDRLYNVRSVVDRAGAVVERYAYNPYGRPQIRQSAGRGDMDNNTDITATDTSRYGGVQSGTGWDSRADMNDDGSVNGLDNSAYGAALATWKETSPQVGWAFSRVDNPFMFQGRPHMAIDSLATARGEGTLMLNDHRARFEDPVVGRWVSRDPLYYNDQLALQNGQLSVIANSSQGRLPLFLGKKEDRARLFEYLASNPNNNHDPSGYQSRCSSAPKILPKSDSADNIQKEDLPINNPLAVVRDDVGFFYEVMHVVPGEASTASFHSFAEAFDLGIISFVATNSCVCFGRAGGTMTTCTRDDCDVGKSCGTSANGDNKACRWKAGLRSFAEVAEQIDVLVLEEPDSLAFDSIP
ncbi:MAG: hypothetical protein MI923_14825 [Phycisphaerales bacterium]|nr:hypothetical protein [Phycisphaerales bacterium]